MLWSRWVRLTHWSVAALVLFNFFGDTGRVHRWIGYGALALVLTRVVLGFIKPTDDPARIRFPAPKEIRQHLSELFSRKAHPHWGHNPAGMWAALVMWALIIALGISGWMTQLDAYWGEEWLEELHETLAHALQVAVLIHWAGVIVTSALLKTNLVRPMITGRADQDPVKTEPGN